MAASAPAPAHLLQKLAEKQQELDNLLLLRQLSSSLRTQFDELAEQFDGLVQGNQAVSKVLGNWGNVFRTIDLADAYASEEQDREGASLVRIPIVSSHP